jgi:phage I-like protein
MNATNQKTEPAADRRTMPLRATEIAESPAPTRVKIAPWGQVESKSGVFLVDDESAQLVLDAFENHGADLPIDYEHQTLGGPYASPNGQAPAAGWIKRVEVAPGAGLYALVEWTADAMRQIANRQYRYLSPVAIVRHDDNRLIAVHSVALTNKPAIINADPIINRDDANRDAAPPRGTPPQSVPDAQTALKRLRRRLDVGQSADVAAILIAAGDKLDAQTLDLNIRDAERRVREAEGARRLTPAQRGFAVRLAMRDPELFESWLVTVPQAAPTGRMEPPAQGESGKSRHTLAASAKSEYRAEPLLQSVTTEDAYVALCLKERRAPDGATQTT